MLALIALAAEGAVAAAWAALAARWMGRVPAIALALGVFVIARLGVPGAVRAVLPSPLSLSIADLSVRTSCAVVTTIGLSLLTSIAPAMGERGA